MKLIKCYVENFGKINKQEFQFDDNLTIFKEENGWGKTTLSIFIEAMLYGFDKSSKDKELRKKYKPWNNGKYGGNLDLEIGKDLFRIERFFGDTPKGDSFKLINLKTNKEANDYKDNIGEEIFKLDKPSFEKSIYIPQQAIAIEISDDLTTKLTNLDTIKDDMNKFGEAKKILTKKRDELKKKIKNTDAEINELDNKIENCANAQSVLERYQEEYNKLKEEQKNKKKDIEKLEETLKKVNEQKLKLEIKKRYTKIEEDEKSSKEKLDLINEFFKNKIPEQLDIETIENKINLIKRAKDDIKDIQDKKEETEIYNDLKAEDIENMQILYESYKTLEQNIQDVKKDRSMKEYMLNNTKNNNTYNIISILIFLVGVICLIFVNPKIIGILILLFSIVFFIISNEFLGKNKKLKEAKKELESIDEKIKNNNQDIEKQKNELSNFIKKYGQEFNENTIYEDLFKIKSNYEKIKKALATIDENQLDVKHFLYNYYNEITEDYNKYIDEIKENLYNKKIVENSYNEALKLKQEFLSEHNIEELEKVEDIDENTEDISNKINEIKSNLEIIMKNIAFNEKKMDEYSSIIDEKVDLENDLENNNKQKEELENKKHIIDKTIEILEKTKERLSTKYLEGMNDNLNKYIELIAKDSKIINKTSIDIDLNTNIEVDGEKKDIENFSTGYKDLIGIALRLALVDSIFKDEKPFLILDDPFVNLDEEKMANSLKLIKEISKNFQIIYFACHNSRI